ncbi:tryptophan-rich sensory protein [Novosphingobium olei]|uniref:Tryptophan-rich sensory protein n=1 Tax=Novosphingobium olei TaxID=2728851 RepID=A0A7Y0BTG9_9SPHN|nr:tryptophan-rich sensory protein [Novosphingobium olei]NML96257.1 hypothetical protein [Novosphingobium olei]
MNYIASRDQLVSGTIRAMLFFGASFGGVFFFAAQLALATGKGAWFDLATKPDLYPGPAVYCMGWFATSLLAGCASAIVFSSRGARRRRLALACLALASLANLLLIAVMSTSAGNVSAIAAVVVATVAVCVSAGIAASVRVVAGILLAPSLLWLCAHCFILWIAEQPPRQSDLHHAAQLRLSI